LRSASQTEKVLPGPVATVSVAPPRLNTIVGSPIPTLFKATAKDQFGNIRSGDAITWSVGSRGGTISSTGLYTTGTTGGLFIVKAKDGTPFGYALVFVAKSPTATSVSPMSTNPDTYVVGSPIYFNVVVSNAGPIQLPSLPSGTVTWSESEVGGLFSNGHGKYNQCTLGVQSSTNACSVYYSTTHVGQVTITASYGGDQTFQGSSNTYSITVLSMTQAFSALSNAISNLPLSSAQSSYLDYDLSDAESSYGTFNCKAGANFMEAFIDQIYSYEQQGILTSAQGDPLIEDANAIISGAHYCQITLQTNGS